jgi:hypothetical protein
MRKLILITIFTLFYIINNNLIPKAHQSCKSKKQHEFDYIVVGSGIGGT